MSIVNNSCNDTLKVLYYNARSIVHKIDELRSNCLLYKPDIVCVTETWLDSVIENSELSIPDYELIRLDRNRQGGGIAIFIASHLSFQVISSGPYFLEFLALCIKCTSGNFVVSVLYRPPSSPGSFFDNLSLILEDLCIPLYSTFNSV